MIKNNISFLIRHSDRDEIPAGSFGNELQINKAGKLNALDYGKRLSKERINKIVTSPVIRCVQTAEFIIEGYGQAIELKQSEALGSPGMHISDEKTASELFQKYDSFELYRKYINGETMPGIRSHKDLKYKLSSFIRINSDQPGITIFITHDILIAFYHFIINETVYSKSNWINYLTGLTLKNGVYEG